jgi:adiponectin receptor
MRIPESLRPGKFDLLGASHQVFHILVVLATVVQLVGILKAFDYNYRYRTCSLA